MVRTRRSFWLGVMIAFLAAGTLASVVGARSVARGDSSRARQVFLASAAEISSTLQLAIVHEQDLTISTGAVLIRNPDTTEADFLGWTKSVRAFARYPEVQTIFDIQLVRPSQLQRVCGPTGRRPVWTPRRPGDVRRDALREPSLLLPGVGVTLAEDDD